MQGGVRAAKKKEEEQPAPPTVPKPAEMGRQVPVRKETVGEKQQREVAESLNSAAASIIREELSAKLKLLREPLPGEKEMRNDYFYSILFPVCGDKDFLEFKKGEIFFQLPLEGTREYNALLDLTEITDPPSKYFEISIDWENKTVTISNKYLKERETWTPLLPQIEKILARGDDAAVVGFNANFNALLDARKERDAYAAMWSSLRFETGETAGMLLSDIRDLYILETDFIKLYRDRIDSIAKNGTAPPLSKDAERLLGGIKVLQESVEKLRLEFAFEKMTGRNAIARIEKGIEAGLYSEPEIALFGQKKAELEEAIKGISPVRKGERMDALSGSQKLELDRVMEVVDTLEVIAWKQDAAELRSALLAGGGRTPLMGKVQAGAKLSLEQFKTREKARVAVLAERAAAYCDLVENFIQHASFAETGELGFTAKDRERFMDLLDSEKEKVKNATMPLLLSSSSESIAKIGHDAALKLSERYEEMQMENPRNKWYVRASSFAKLRILRNAPEIMAGGAVVGGAIGLGTTRTPHGAGGGAIMGAKVAGYAVGTVAVFAAAEAFYRYLSSESGSAEEKRAAADMRSGVVHMGFAIGGLPGAAGKALTIGVGGAMFGSAAVLTYEDMKEGDYFAVASDLAYAAMGSVAFLRIGGGFRAVALRENLGETVVFANSAGITRAAAEAKFAKYMAEPLKAGYSLPWITANTIFATTAAYPELATAIENGDPKAFLNGLGRSFEEVTSTMVTLEFAIIRPGFTALGLLGKGASWAGSKAYRLAMRGSDARLAQYTAQQGLFESVSGIAMEGGAKVGDEGAGRLLDLAFGERGRVSPDYVQASLGLKGPEGAALAEKIAKEIKVYWNDARIALSKNPKSTKFVLNQIEKFRKAADSRALAYAGKGLNFLALGGGIVMMEAKSLRDRILDRHFSKLLSQKEMDFVTVLRSPATEMLGIDNKVAYPMFREALATVEALSEKIASGKHPLSNLISLKKADENTRQKFLYSCAIALLINGKAPAEAETASLADRLDRTLSLCGIRISPLTRLDSLALLASALLLKGEGAEEDFSEYSTGIKSDYPKLGQPVALDYAASSFFLFALGSKDLVQSRNAMEGVLGEKMKAGSAEVHSLWVLVLSMDMLGGGLGETQASDAVSSAESIVAGVLLGRKAGISK